MERKGNFGLKELLEFDVKPPGKNPNINSCIFSPIPPLQNGVNYRDIIAKEIEEGEKFRDQSVEVPIEESNKLNGKEPIKSKNNDQPDVRNSMSVGRLFGSFPQDGNDFSFDFPKQGPKNAIIKDYSTEMEEWQSKFEEDNTKTKMREIEDRQFVKNFDLWRSDLKQNIDDSSPIYYKELEEFIQKGQFVYIKNKEILKKEIDNWSQSFTLDLQNQMKSVDVETESIRKIFSSKFDVLTREVDHIKQQVFEKKILEEVKDDVKDELTLIDQRIFQNQLGTVQPKALKELSSDTDSEGEEVCYLSCSDDEESNVITPEKIPERIKRKSLPIQGLTLGNN